MSTRPSGSNKDEEDVPVKSRPFNGLVTWVIDFLRLSVDWWTLLRDSIGQAVCGSAPCSFCDSIYADTTGDREIPSASRYNHPVVFRAVCPCALITSETKRGDSIYCRHINSFHRKNWHVFVTGLILLLVWGGLLTGIAKLAFPEDADRIVVSEKDVFVGEGRVPDREMFPAGGGQADKAATKSMLMLEADAAYRLANYREARELYVSARRFDLWDLELRCQIALCDHHLGAYQKAIDEYERCLDRSSGFAKAHQGIAAVYRSMLLPDKAMECLVQSRLHSEREPYTALLMMRCWEDMNQLGDAEDEAFLSLALGTQDPVVQAEAGGFFLRSGDVETATTCFQTALQLDEDHVAALLGIAAIYCAEGEISKARDVLTQALAVEPGPQTEAMMQYCSGEGADYAALVEKYPDNQELRLQYARDLFGKGRIEPALTLANELKESTHPGLVLRTCELMAQIQMALGRYREAISLGQEMVSLDRFSLQGRRIQIDAMMAIGESRDALTIIDEVLSISNGDLAIKLMRAHIWEQVGDRVQAVGWLREISDEYRNDTQALYLLGTIYFEQRELLLARSTFSRIVERAPSDEVALECLAAIDYIMAMPDLGPVNN